MQLTDDSRFMIKDALPGKGSGLFAVQAIESGAFILEYTGEKLPTATAEDTGSPYLFVLDDDWTINGPVPQNTAGYINHACDPNTEAIIEGDHINIYATREIASGEELTIDYGEEYFDEYIKPDGCKCAGCLLSIPRFSQAPLAAN